jgi:hypothetical protein
LLPILHELVAALKSQNSTEIDRLLDELSKKQLDVKTKETIEQISDQVLMADFDGALKTGYAVLSIT